ncbi:MAG: fibronectin type III domain-containing protein [Chloroflexi bacterium]|nr:fibronectin type III domain-containing protein [Chloroflexota bacterium]
MNFSRNHIGAANPISNRFLAAIVATIAALTISVFGSGQWASADSGTVVPGPDPDPAHVPGAPRHVTARPGDGAAAVAWIPPAGDVHISGYIVTADPSGIWVETVHDDKLVIVEGLENGVEYTFTVVAFNDAGLGEVSEPSNPVIPEEGLELDEEKLERLREHLRKLAHEARVRLHEAEVRAREKLEETEGRVHDRLERQTALAREFIKKARVQAEDRHVRQVDQARNWFDRLKDQLHRRLERAEGTDRYDKLSDRATETLDRAHEKLADRIEKSDERSMARIARAEETVKHRLEKANEQAENAIKRTQHRLTKRISKLQERLHDLLQRLARIKGAGGTLSAE